MLNRFAIYLGVQPAEVYELFDIANLIEEYPGPASPGSKWDAFPRDEAADGARRIRHLISSTPEEGRPWTRVVTIGRGATSVFWGDRRGFGKIEWFRWYVWPLVDLPHDMQGAASPHPGGTSFFWNDIDNRERAIKWWRETRDYARAR